MNNKEAKDQENGKGMDRVTRMSGIMLCIIGAVVMITASAAAGSVLYLLQKKKRQLKSEQVNLE